MLWKMLDTRSIFAASQGGIDPKKPRGWAGRSGKAGKIKSTHQRGLESMERHRPAMTTTSRPSLMTAGRSLQDHLWWLLGGHWWVQQLGYADIPCGEQVGWEVLGGNWHFQVLCPGCGSFPWQKVSWNTWAALLPWQKEVNGIPWSCTTTSHSVQFPLDKRDVPVVFFEQCHCFLTKEVVAVVGFQAPPWQKGVALEKTQSIKPAKRE